MINKIGGEHKTEYSKTMSDEDFFLEIIITYLRRDKRSSLNDLFIRGI